MFRSGRGYRVLASSPGSCSGTKLQRADSTGGISRLLEDGFGYLAQQAGIGRYVGGLVSGLAAGWLVEDSDTKKMNGVVLDRVQIKRPNTATICANIESREDDPNVSALIPASTAYCCDGESGVEV